VFSASSVPQRAQFPATRGLRLADAPQAALEGFQMFAEALPCITWSAGASGVPTWFNQDFHRYTGLNRRGAALHGWIGCVHSDEKATITRKFAHCVASGTTLDSIIRLRSAEGSYRWFSARARPYRDADGAIIAWLGTLTDVDDRQNTFEANTHVAKALMQAYLSKKFPVAKGLVFDTYYRPANALERLGGDWYDVFELPDHRIGFSLGDVCGHGIDAAVKMGEAKQAIFLAACLGVPAPESVLQQANKVLFLNNHDASMTTAIYGVVDTVRETVTYASAGHHPPILAGKRETVVLPNHGFPLGVEEHMPPRIKTHEFSYESGSTMVLYTDGLIEFSHDMLEGEARLLRAATESVRRKAANPAKFIAEHVLDDASPRDDIAVLTLSFQNE